tara:strand:- start:871 stop:1587 length:717 start_codon:yes stop_codon:yes gene_type:complete
MAISVNNVYQKVLALANKEQRGYIPPQDFNLFANQAQLEIFEQYFYDLNKARKIQGNDTEISDIGNIIEDKLHIFEVFANKTTVNGFGGASPAGKILPIEAYRLLSVVLQQAECEILNTKDYESCKKSPLTNPTKARPIANLQGRTLKCNDGNSDIKPTTIVYLRIPDKVNWTYVVINKRAMYNSTAADKSDFELHASEEIQLVNKILKLSGLSTEQEDVMKAGHGMENIVSQQQQNI